MYDLIDKTKMKNVLARIKAGKPPMCATFKPAPEEAMKTVEVVKKKKRDEQGELDEELRQVAKTDNVDRAKVLIARGANVNGRYRQGKDDMATALWNAVYGENLEMAKFLLDNGADANAMFGFESTALGTATALVRPKDDDPEYVDEKMVKMVKLLKKYGASEKKAKWIDKDEADQGKTMCFTIGGKKSLEKQFEEAKQIEDRKKKSDDDV